MYGIQVGLIATVIGLSASVGPVLADEEWPRTLLQVIRLKPGEEKTFELALPVGDVHANIGRDTLQVSRITKDGRNVKTEPVLRNAKGVYDLGGGLTVAWDQEKPGVSVGAAKGANSGTTDLQLDYRQFTIGTGQHLLGFRVIVHDMD